LTEDEKKTYIDYTPNGRTNHNMHQFTLLEFDQSEVTGGGVR